MIGLSEESSRHSIKECYPARTVSFGVSKVWAITDGGKGAPCRLRLIQGSLHLYHHLAATENERWPKLKSQVHLVLSNHG